MCLWWGLPLPVERHCWQQNKVLYKSLTKVTFKSLVKVLHKSTTSKSFAWRAVLWTYEIPPLVLLTFLLFFSIFTTVYSNTVIAVFSIYTRKYSPVSKYQPSLRGRCDNWWQYLKYKLKKQFLGQWNLVVSIAFPLEEVMRFFI